MKESTVTSDATAVLVAALLRKTATKSCETYLKDAFTAFQESRNPDTDTFRRN